MAHLLLAGATGWAETAETAETAPRNPAADAAACRWEGGQCQAFAEVRLLDAILASFPAISA